MSYLAAPQHFFRNLLAKYQGDSPYRLPVILAVALHLLLFIILFARFASPEVLQLSVQPDVDIIKAVAVSPEQISQMAQAKAEQQRLQQQALEQQKRQQEAVARAKAEELKQQQALREQQQEQAKQQALAAQQEKQAQQAAKQAAAQKAAQQQALQQQAADKALAEKAAADKAATAKAATDKAAAAQKAAAATEKAAAAKKQQDMAAKQQAAKQQEAAQLKAAQQKLMQEQIAAEQRDLQAARTKQQLSEIQKYKALIEQAISQNWEVPTGTNVDLSCELMIRLGPGGAVLNVQVSRSSGDPALDSSARAAVFKASPLPVPNDPDLFNQFREIRLTVKPEDVQNQ